MVFDQRLASRMNQVGKNGALAGRGGSGGAGRRRGPSLTGRPPGRRRYRARTLSAEAGFGEGQGVVDQL